MEPVLLVFFMYHGKVRIHRTDIVLRGFDLYRCLLTEINLLFCGTKVLFEEFEAVSAISCSKIKAALTFEVTCGVMFHSYSSLLPVLPLDYTTKI